MSLELPADCEPFIPDGEGFDYLHNPAVYALELTRPDDLASAWDAEFDHRPAYWDQLTDACKIVYVGEAGDVLRRLEEHRDGDVRVGVLQRVCDIHSLRNIWWMQSKEEAEEQESALAIAMQNEYGKSHYVHYR
jgi:predicted GIY-YIG superfamily endonuclease